MANLSKEPRRHSQTSVSLQIQVYDQRIPFKQTLCSVVVLWYPAALGFRTISRLKKEKKQRFTMIQETDILTLTWELPTSPTILCKDIKRTKKPSRGKTPEMQAAPQCTFCIRRNVDPKRHSASCRVDQWAVLNSDPEVWIPENDFKSPCSWGCGSWSAPSHTKSQAVTRDRWNGAGVAQRIVDFPQLLVTTT